MKRRFSRVIGIALALVLLVTSMPYSLAADAFECPLEITVETNKDSYSTVGIATINVTVKNISDEDVENVSTEVLFDNIVPIGRFSSVGFDVDSIKAGEEKDFSFKATLNPYAPEIGFLQSFLIRLIGFFAGSPSIDDPIEDARAFVDEAFQMKFGNIEVEPVIRVWYDGSTANFVSFSASKIDIPVGTTETVIFSATLLTEYAVPDAKIDLISDDGTYAMYDNGEYPDSEANDGVFTTAVNLQSNVRKNVQFEACYKNKHSDSVNICFYNDLTDQDYQVLENVFNAVEAEDNLNNVVNYLRENEEIESYNVEDDGSVFFTTKSGMSGSWSEEIAADLKGAYVDNAAETEDIIVTNSSDLSVAVENPDVLVIRPYRNSQFNYDDFKDVGEDIADLTNGSCVVRDETAVTLAQMKNFDDYGVVLIDSHGSLANDNPYILTGETFNRDSESFDDADWQSSNIIAAGGRVAVGSGFFDKYYSANSFDETLFFIGTCHSMSNNSIANSLLEKGASVVYGYDDSVSVKYCNETLHSLFDGMIDDELDSQQAYDATCEECGTFDPYSSNRAEFKYEERDVFTFYNEKGRLSGIVRSYDTMAPIDNAFCIISREGSVIPTFYMTNSSGNLSIKLKEGTYTIRIMAYGYLFKTIYNVVIRSGETTYISESTLLIPNNRTGSLNGVVVNALTGDEVENARIRLLRKVGVTSPESFVRDSEGNILEVTSDESGALTIDNLPIGYYTAIVEAEDFVTEYIDVVISDDDRIQYLSITPVLPEGQYRIVLEWGEDPRDLDSHITGPRMDGSNFHVYYANRDAFDGEYYVANLDVDDTTSYGPETVTLNPTTTGTYTYFIHHYAGYGSISMSGASVKLYKGNTLLATYYAPTDQGTGIYWTVFEISNDEVHTINRISSSVSYNSSDITLQSEADTIYPPKN